MKVLTVTGSSGGHIFPALSFLDTLSNKYKDIDILLVLPKKNITHHRESLKYKLNYISISSVKLNFGFRNLGAISRFFKGALESIIMLLTFRPDVVVGFGSLACIPMILFARLLRMKTLIHEQNVIPGRANRFLAKFTDRIAISFAETRDYFMVQESIKLSHTTETSQRKVLSPADGGTKFLEGYTRKIILTGNPIRKELNRVDKNKALGFFGFNSGKFTILVMGGSLGSHRINSMFLKAVSAVPDKSGFQVIHLTGPADYDFLKGSYKDLNINSCLFNFLEPMQYAYSACDLVISRAGATTVAEIIFFGLAAILIPYPFAYRHQTANAKVLENIGSGIIIQDNASGSDIILRKTIENLVNNPEGIKAMRSYYGNILRLNANDLLAEAVLSF